jgi:hypothetical protein
VQSGSYQCKRICKRIRDIDTNMAVDMGNKSVYIRAFRPGAISQSMSLISIQSNRLQLNPVSQVQASLVFGSDRTFENTEQHQILRCITTNQPMIAFQPDDTLSPALSHLTTAEILKVNLIQS